MKNLVDEHSAIRNKAGVPPKAPSIESKRRKRLRRLITIIEYLLVAVILAYIYLYLHSNWEQLKALHIHVNVGTVILAFGATIAAWLISCWNFEKAIQAFGFKLPYRNVYIVYFRSNLAKYLPGWVWHLAGSAYLARQMGVPEGSGIAAFVVGQIYSVLAALIIVMGTVSFEIVKGPAGMVLPFKWTAILILVVSAVLVVRPNIIGSVMNLVLPRLRRHRIRTDIKFSSSLFLLIIYIIPWIFFGLAFWFLAGAITSVSFALFIPITFVFLSGMIIGYIAIFAPAGIGVREASIAALASVVLPFPAAFFLAVSIGFRIISTIVEVIAFGVSWLWHKNSEGAYGKRPD